MQDTAADPRHPSRPAGLQAPLRPPHLAALATAGALVALLLLPAAGARGAATAPAHGTHGMVVSPQADATRVGVDILRQGGNAVDAAVATAFALGVTDPFHSGLGGGGFLVIHMGDGRVVAIDARETAPAAATRDMYTRPGIPADASRVGALSVATPGLVAGLAQALDELGTISFADALAPAIRLAEEGFEVGPSHVDALRRWKRSGSDERFPETARIHLPPPGTPLEPGWRLVQEDLARTLRTLARDGPQTFYEGEIAKAIAAEIERRGGVLTLQDLETYHAKRRDPIKGRYRGHTIYSFPPPSSGGVALVEVLNILEGFDLEERGAGSSSSIHVIAEALKLAFADRAAHLGDPDFVYVPVERLTSKRYAKELRGRINPPFWRRAPWTWLRGEHAIDVSGPGRIPPEDGGTTHLSVADGGGNAVAITQTINTLFGSGITVPGTGVVLNDEMDDFSIAPNTPNVYGLVDTTGVNAIAPGKRPLSSMSPTVVTKDGRPFLVTGSPGGPRIISTTLLTILNVIDYDMDVSSAVAYPRFHHQWRPDDLYVEPEIPGDVVDALEGRGHDVEIADGHWSSAQTIRIDPRTGRFTGGTDPRSDGLALGYSPGPAPVGRLPETAEPVASR